MAMMAFNDGICDICRIHNIAEPGEQPRDGLFRVYAAVRYAERVVGYRRYYTAMQTNVRIDFVLRMLRLDDVRVFDVVTIGDEQYRIEQIQHVPDLRPCVMDLSLHRLERKYECKCNE